MKKQQEHLAFLFIRRRAEQLYLEGQIDSARRLLRWLDAAQERRFRACRSEKVQMAE